jgi:hypothetical protein
MDSLPERAPMSSPSRLGAGRRPVLAAGLLLALAGLGCAAPALAEPALVQVDVIDRDSGAPLRVYRDHGRPVVAGRPGARYAVRLVNRSGERVLAVVAIDGVNILGGETASVDQRGYVLDPWQSAALTGWRKSDDEVAVFEFTALADSYAARTGRPLDVGVIGVAVFRERREPLEAARVAPAARAADLARSPAASAKAGPADAGAGEARAAAPPAAERLGTGHGPREASPVTTTTFLRATALPEQRVAIRYDSLANLVAAGIAPRPPVAADGPRAFPADPAPGYVPDPPLR